MSQSIATRMREEFDARFALPATVTAHATVDILAISLGGLPYALRLDEIAGVCAGRRIVALPGSSPDLLGLMGLRGALVRVHSLSALLGLPVEAHPRWVATCGLNGSVGFAFGKLDAYLRVEADAFHADSAPHLYVGGVVRIAGEARPLISLAQWATAHGRPAPESPPPLNPRMER